MLNISLILSIPLGRSNRQAWKQKIWFIIMKTWGMNSGTWRHWWWIEKALEPVRRTRCPFTQSSQSHTFLLSLTQSMLGGMVSRATERHFSLTTVQDAEMEDISLHLRCGSPGAYSSTTSRTKQPWPLWQRRKTEFHIEKYNRVKMPREHAYGWNRI